jgi:hypothetical protein
MLLLLLAAVALGAYHYCVSAWLNLTAVAPYGTPGVSPVDRSAAREGGKIQIGACGERRVSEP